MKKSALLLGSMISSLGLITAQTATKAGETAGRVGTEIGGGIIGFFSGLITSLGGGVINLQQAFMGLLLFMIIYSVVSIIFGNFWKGWGSTIIAAAITGISLVALDQGVIDAIAIQYGAMGAAILTVMPLLIIIIFTTRVRSILIARMTWIFYVFYYFFLYISATVTDNFTTTASGFYLGAIAIGIFMFFGTKSIRDLLIHGKHEEMVNQFKQGAEFRKATREALKEEGETMFGKTTK